MYISIVTYIDTCVLHNSVAFLIEADDVTDLDLVSADLIALVGLAGRAVRQADVVIGLITVHYKT